MRLVTFVDFDDGANQSTVSISARHELELAGGRRALLLNDRGWTSSGPSNVWAHTTEQEIVDTARAVVGPDEPFGTRTEGEMATAHWRDLQQSAQKQSVEISAGELRRLPHDVEISARLRRRLHH